MIKGKNKSGPSPYSGRQLPSPKNVIAEMSSPFRVHEAIFFLGSFGFILGIALSYYTNTVYHDVSMYALSFSILAGVVSSSLQTTSSLHSSTPSINAVSNTTSYATSASRLVVLTVVAISLTGIIMILTHVINLFYVIDPSTRFAVTLVIMASSILSTILVMAICSYSAIIDNELVAKAVGVSSIPEITSIIGFVVAPVVVLATGVIYNGPPIVDIPFAFSFVDSYLLLFTTLILYISVASRLG